MKLPTQHLLAATVLGVSGLLGGNAAAQANTTSLSGWHVDGDVVVQGDTTITLTTAFIDNDLNGDQPYNLSGMSAVDIATLETSAGVADYALGFSQEPDDQGYEGSLVSQSFAASAGQTLSFDWSFATRETLYRDRAFIVIGGSVFTLATPATPGLSTQAFSHTFSNAGAASFAIGVVDIGDATGVSSLSIRNLQVSTPAVPEPGTWALLLAGLGLVGFMSKRRRSGGGAG